MPKYGFLVAARDAESTLSACLDSLVLQSEPDWAAVVVDDGSQDGTSRVANNFASVDARIRTVRTHTNAGSGSARNLARTLLDCEWLVVADADDVSYSWRLSKYGHLIRMGYDVVGGRADVSCGRRATAVADVPEVPADIVDCFRSGHMGVLHPTVAFRASLFDAVGGYDNSLRRAQDLNLLLRMADHTERFTNCDVSLIRYNVQRFISYRRWRELEYWRLQALREANKLLSQEVSVDEHGALHLTASWIKRNVTPPCFRNSL